MPLSEITATSRASLATRREPPGSASSETAATGGALVPLEGRPTLPEPGAPVDAAAELREQMAERTKRMLQQQRAHAHVAVVAVISIAVTVTLVLIRGGVEEGVSSGLGLFQDGINAERTFARKLPL